MPRIATKPQRKLETERAIRFRSELAEFAESANFWQEQEKFNA